MFVRKRQSEYQKKNNNESNYQKQKNIYQETNIIQITRKLIKSMNQKQKFEKAKAHIMDALQNQKPRPYSESKTTSLLFKIVYFVFTSLFWRYLLLFLSFVFMYLVILDNQNYSIKIITQSIVIFFFWVDFIMLVYTKSFDNIKKKQKYTTYFICKILLILISTVDLFIFAIFPNYGSRPIRPFRVFRACIPIIYNTNLRKMFYSLASTYKDILVFKLFFIIIIVGWAIVGSKGLQFDVNFLDSEYPIYVDPYKNYYSNLSSMIFIMYVCASFDGFPDNQLLAAQNYSLNYLFFCVFCVANMFIFSTIPAEFIYIKMRQTHSKLILLDQINQKHSLILAFVTLAENKTNLQVKKLNKFLLFLYRYKIRYIQYVADIILKLDTNTNGTIQVSEFMQISNIILSNSAYYPPKFDDIRLWVDFRRFMLQTFHIKAIVLHWGFQVALSLLIFFSFINAVIFVFNPSSTVQIIDTIFIWIFVVQLLIRIIALGPQSFFVQRWNNIDCLISLCSVIFYLMPIESSSHAIIRMTRVFRLSTLLRLVSHSNYLKDVKFQSYNRLVQLFSVIFQIMPIILRYFSYFVFFFYIFGIIGMQLFYQFSASSKNTNYNMYQQFSHFKDFIGSQYLMFQVYMQAGWSNIAYDYSWKAPQYRAYIMLYFCLMHFYLVYVVSNLLKGIIWQVYFTVRQVMQEWQFKTMQEIRKQKQNNEIAAEINEINKIFKQKQYINPDTVLRRELYQNFIDKQIFKHIAKDLKVMEKQIQGQIRQQSSSRMKKMMVFDRMMQHWQINIKQLGVSQQMRQRYTRSLCEQSSELKSQVKSEIHEENFLNQIQNLLDKALINPKTKYSHINISPKSFSQFLKNKLVLAKSLIKQSEFNIHENPLYNQQSIRIHIDQMQEMLGIQTSKRDQKAKVVKKLLQQKIINEDKAQALIKRKLKQKKFGIDTSGILRKLYLSQTNQQLLKKLQIQLFSDMHGEKFKQINKMTLQPLLRLQASLTFTLRNIFRYPQIPNTQFFSMFTYIQDKISNQLLRKGSLFKFIYQLDYEGGDVWFSIQYKKSQSMSVHFIKKGIWINTKDFLQKQIYYARDVFKWTSTVRNSLQQISNFTNYLHKFYQNFQGLAFSLINKHNFYQDTPQTHVYDLYIQHFNVQKLHRFKKRQLQISQIMLIILSKEQLRSEIQIEDLPYQLSDLTLKKQKKRRQNLTFNFDDSDDKTYQKLTNLAAGDTEKIIETQGLPFSYIVNLMQEMNDIVEKNGVNFIYQIQKVLNKQFEVFSVEKQQNENKNSN